MDRILALSWGECQVYNLLILLIFINDWHQESGFLMSRLSDHGWHFGVEGPARYQILHGHGIVARAQTVLQI